MSFDTMTAEERDAAWKAGTDFVASGRDPSLIRLTDAPVPTKKQFESYDDDLRRDIAKILEVGRSVLRAEKAIAFTH